MKKCAKCGKEKEFPEFYKNKNTGDGYNFYCKICAKEKNKEYNNRNRELCTEEYYKSNELLTKTCGECKKAKKLNEFAKHISNKDGFADVCEECSPKYKRKPQQSEPTRIKVGIIFESGKTQKCKICNKIKPIELFDKNITYKNGYSRKCKMCRKIQDHEKLKSIRKEVIKHYGAKCKNCSITDLDVLTIDHIDNNGAYERREFKNTLTFYKHIIKNNFPLNYQILCYNCNVKKYKMLLEKNFYQEYSQICAYTKKLNKKDSNL